MFKKGQTVYLIRDWDEKGTVKVIKAIVYSCGKQRMVLTDAVTGKELGRNFYPRREQRRDPSWPYCDIVVAQYDPAEAMAFAELRNAWRRDHYARCLGNPMYNQDAIRKSEAEQHEPRVEWLHRAEG